MTQSNGHGSLDPESPPPNMNLGRRPSWSFDFMVSTASEHTDAGQHDKPRKRSKKPTWKPDVSDASRQAEVLRLRRAQTATSGSDDSDSPVHALQRSNTYGSEGSEADDLNSPYPSSPKRQSSEAIGVKDALDTMELNLVNKCNDLDKKMDRIISHMDCCFAQYRADLHLKVAHALESRSKSTVTQHEQHSPRVIQRDTTLGAKAKQPQRSLVNARKICFTPPAMPSSFTPRSPRSEEENIEPGGLTPRLQEIPESRFYSEKTERSTSTSQKHSLEKGKSNVSLSREPSFDMSQIEAIQMNRGRERSRIAQIAWLYLEDPQLLPSGLLYVRFIIFIILANCCINIVQTLKSPPLGRLTEAVFEYTVDGILSLEVFVRFLVCPNRFTFWTNGFNVLDLVTGPLTLVVRVALPLCFPDDATASTLLASWLPLGQLLRLLRRFDGSYLIYTALRNASEALPVLLYVLLLIITIFASLLYVLEPRDSIGSLPESLWFTVVTLGTVGYGDVTPQTPEGKVTTCILVIVSALYMAIPLGIVGKVFAEVYDDRKRLLLTQLARQRFQTLGYTAKDIPAMFLSADANMDGVLDLEEFTVMMKRMQFDTSGQRATELFEVFDVDGGGHIDDREFLETIYPDFTQRIYGESEGDISGNGADHSADDQQV